MEATKTLLKVGEELEKEESGEVPLWGAGGNKCVSNGRRKGYVWQCERAEVLNGCAGWRWNKGWEPEHVDGLTLDSFWVKRKNERIKGQLHNQVR